MNSRSCFIDIDLLEQRVQQSLVVELSDSSGGGPTLGRAHERLNPFYSAPPPKMMIPAAASEASDNVGGMKSSGEPGLNTEFNTLNEPIWTTVKRDLKTAKEKIKQVLLPPEEGSGPVFHDWDIWGPIFIYITFSLILQGTATSGLPFTCIFSMIFFGSVLAAVALLIIGVKIGPNAFDLSSLVQTICVIGYCLLPSMFAALGCKIIGLLLSNTVITVKCVRLMTAGFGLFWSTYAFTAFLAGAQPERRHFVGYSPVIIFYFVVSWMVIANT